MNDTCKHGDVKLLGICLIIAVVLQFLVCRVWISCTDSKQWFLLALWGAGVLILAWRVLRALYVYLGSVALIAPAVSYSMVGYGVLEMGGYLHVLMAGVWALVPYVIFGYFRRRAQSGTTPPLIT